MYNQWMPHVHVDYHEQGNNDPIILHRPPNLIMK